LCVAGSALAQERLTLQEAVKEATTRHPALAAADSRIVASEALVRQADLKPNPRAFLQVENLRSWGQPGLVYSTDTDNFAYLAQRFEAGHKRERRVELARANVQMSTLERSVLLREIAARVAAAYWNGVVAAGLRDLLRQDLKVFEGTVQYHRDRVQQGAMAEVDLMRILLERDRLSVAVRNAELEAHLAVLSVLREMGRAGDQPLELADPLPQIRDIAPPDSDSAVNARPEVLSARAAVVRARRNVSLQQANARPDPEALFGYKRTAGFDTLMAGFQLDLPFRNRNQGAIAAATAEVKAAESTAIAIERRIRAEIAAAYAEYSAKQQLVRDTLLPMRERADEVARISRAAYLEGGTDLLRVIDAERSRLDAQLAYYRVLGEYQQRLTALQFALGEMP
jgi:outer membrane protein TolC